MSFSDYMENWLLNQIVSGKTLYVGYLTASGESSYTEPTGNGYAREAYGSYTVTSVPGDDQYISNDSAITFDQATGAQGTVTHMAIFDALSGGNFLGSVSFAEMGLDNISVIAGTTVIIPAGDGKIKID